MTQGRLLTGGEFWDVLTGFDHTLTRLELQDRYTEASEAELLAAWTAGDPFPATEVPGLRDWYDNVSAHVAAGGRVERVRVQQDPPTSYQQFERWLDRWNLESGEVMRYLTRERAFEIGLLPAAGNEDWWLADSARLVIMRFDSEGHRIENELVTDPVTVLQACKWRDLAVHHSVRVHHSDVAA